jgi:precorrin-6Y C5,15-methyltransferase (decarboxylating)
MITVVGMDGSALSPRAEAALAAATLVAGARRHLAVAPHQARTVVLGELAPALDALAAHDGDAVVLASGDPGFFGIVRALRGRGLKFTVLPAVSSVALAFARAGLPAWPGPAPGGQRVPCPSQGRGAYRARVRPGGDRRRAGGLGPPARRL